MKRRIKEFECSRKKIRDKQKQPGQQKKVKKEHRERTKEHWMTGKAKTEGERK